MTMIVCACVRSLLPSVVACIAFRAVLPARTRVTPRPGADDDDSVRVRSPVVAFCCGLYAFRAMLPASRTRMSCCIARFFGQCIRDVVGS